MLRAEASGTKTVLNTRPAISATSAIVLPANPKTKWAKISNNSGGTVQLAYGQTAVAAQGIPLATGQSHEINMDKLFLGDVHAVAGGAGNLDVVIGLQE